MTNVLIYLYSVLTVCLPLIGLAIALYILVKMYNYAHAASSGIVGNLSEDSLFRLVCPASFDGLAFGTVVYPFVGFVFSDTAINIYVYKCYYYAHWVLPYGRIKSVTIPDTFLRQHMDINSEHEHVPSVITLWIDRAKAAQLRDIVAERCNNSR